MKARHVLLVAASICFSASAQTPPPTPTNWGLLKDGARVSLFLDKFTYTIGEDIPLHIAAEVVSATHPVYGVPDRPHGAFFKDRDFSTAFHLTITDEHGKSVGYDSPYNLVLARGGSSGPFVCPTPLNAGHVYTLEQSASGRTALLPKQPGTYHLTVTWNLYPPSDPPCVQGQELPESQEFRPFVSVPSPTVTIQITDR